MKSLGENSSKCVRDFFLPPQLLGFNTPADRRDQQQSWKQSARPQRRSLEDKIAKTQKQLTEITQDLRAEDVVAPVPPVLQVWGRGICCRIDHSWSGAGATAWDENFYILYTPCPAAAGPYDSASASLIK